MRVMSQRILYGSGREGNKAEMLGWVMPGLRKVHTLVRLIS